MSPVPRTVSCERLELMELLDRNHQQCPTEELIQFEGIYHCRGFYELQGLPFFGQNTLVRKKDLNEIGEI